MGMQLVLRKQMGLPGTEATNRRYFTLCSPLSAHMDLIYAHEINFKRFQCIWLKISLMLVR